MTSDVVVVGGGLVGLCVTHALVRCGARVTLVDAPRPGAASRIGAGMLAPSVERTGGAAQGFLQAARDAYPDFVATIGDAAGIAIPLDRGGILEIAGDETDAARRRAGASGDAIWCTPDDVRAMDPGYAAPFGAVWHSRDGAVDPVPLLEALELLVARSSSVRRVTELVAARTPGEVRLGTGERLATGVLVLCAGAWSGTVVGLPRPIPVRPVRGQMLELPVAPTRRAAYGAGGYLVPRADGRTYVGATMEEVGFDPSTTPDGAAYLRGVATALAPALRDVPVAVHAAALRPLTPDHLPVIGPDPDAPDVWYACGHGRNGILLAPLTGEVVADAIAGHEVRHDLRPFSASRLD